MIGTSLLFSGSIGGLLTPFDSVAPTAGYSLRALTLSYTGAVVRVRRDGDDAEQDFTPTQITNGDLEAFLNVPAQSEHTVDVYLDLKRGIVPLTKPTQFYNFEDVSLVSDCFTGGSGTMESYDSLFSMVDHNTKVYYDLDFSSLKTDVSLLSPLNSGSSGVLEAFTTRNELIGQSNGFVHTWYDQSGNGYHAVQVTDTDQPKIWDSGTGLVTENGRPALEFDGVDDWMVNTLFSTSGDDTSIFVAKLDTTISQVCFLDSDNPSVAHAILTRPSLTPTHFGLFFDIPLTDLDYALINTNQNLHFVVQSSLQQYGALNGIQDNVTTGNDNYDGLRIGKTRLDTANYSGTMQEIVLYNSDQSANRTDIEDNINNYYDIY